MSKRCPKCGFSNEDSRIYCGSCGELLDAELRLMKELNDQTSGPRKPAAKEPPAREEPAPRPARSYSDDDVMPQKLAKEKKSSPLPWILLGVAVVAVVIFILSYAI